MNIPMIKKRLLYSFALPLLTYPSVSVSQPAVYYSDLVATVMQVWSTLDAAHTYTDVDIIDYYIAQALGRMQCALYMVDQLSIDDQLSSHIALDVDFWQHVTQKIKGLLELMPPNSALALLLMHNHLKKLNGIISTIVQNVESTTYY